jgi:hypothetical protein
VVWKLMNTRKKNHILHLELSKSFGIIAFITFIKKIECCMLETGGMQG